MTDPNTDEQQELPQPEENDEQTPPNDQGTPIEYLPPSADAYNPHPYEEDPEDHLGEEIPDPWTDPSQEDWPNEDDTDEETP